MKHCLLFLACFLGNYTHASVYDEDPVPTAKYPPAMAEVTIPSAGSFMPGLIYIADGKGPHPTVVLLHGFPGNERNLDIAQVLRRAGFNVVFFNYRGAWGAQGKYAIGNLDDDAIAVLEFLRQPRNANQYRVDTETLTLLGHSLGGYTALAAGRQDKELACVGAMSAANAGLWKRAFEDNAALAQRLKAYADTLFMLNGFNAAVMSEQLAEMSMTELDTTGFGNGLSGKSVLLVIGGEDTVVVPEQMFTPLVEAYGKVEGLDLESHIIPGDHVFSWSRVELTELVLDWLTRHCR